jgi:hypothetical protein
VTRDAKEKRMRKKIITPNNKFHISNKFHIPMTQTKTLPGRFLFVLVIGSLVFGAYLEFGAWDLEFYVLYCLRDF